ncbi:hypothetical protein [Flavobacterium sp. KJJ]|uniref:hypothetical protein n=1 Tax=Flavobacterium sp. KJJ TaxID=1270193 RepID=UPI0012F7F9F3|nr:hypothetical protein [Flavobacterium sp. KJJ]
MKVYRISKTWRIIIYSICSSTSLFYGIFGIILLLPAELAPFQVNEEPLVKNLLAVLFLFVVPCMVFLIFKTYKTRIVITQDSFQLIGVFKKKELKFKDIKGFEVSSNPKLNLQKFLGVESKTKGEKAIVFSNLFEKFDEIRSQLSFKVADLNAEKVKVIEEKITHEKKEILKNNDFGFTVEEKTSQLKYAKITARIIYATTFIIGFWIYNYPQPYEYALLSGMMLPIVSLLAIKYWKGLIRVDKIRNSIYPNVAVGILAPAYLLYKRVEADFSILDFSNIWLPLVLAVIIYSAFLFTEKMDLSGENPEGRLVVLFTFIFICGYVYSSVICLNDMFDKSSPVKYTTTILDKEKPGESFIISVAPLEKEGQIQKIKIDKEFYYEAKIGDKASVYVYKGFFNIPYADAFKAN